MAHLVALRRTAIGNVSVENAWHLDALVEAVKARRWGHPLDVVEQSAEHETQASSAHSALEAAAGAVQVGDGEDADTLKPFPVMSSGTKF